MAKRLDFHILNTAAQLSGVSITVLTLFLYLGVSKESFADEMLTASVLLFVLATFLSYLSIRKDWSAAERVADWLFLAGLLCVLITSMILTFVIF